MDSVKKLFIVGTIRNGWGIDQRVLAVYAENEAEAREKVAKLTPSHEIQYIGEAIE